MRTLAAALVAAASVYCGPEAHAQGPQLVPGPSSPVVVGQGSGPVLLADLNGDGHLDLLAKHLLSSSLSILSGDGRGHFTPFEGTPMRLGYQPGAIAIGDVDRDGIPDLGIATRDDKSEYVHILRGDGRGHFEPIPGPLRTAGASAKGYKPSIQLVDVNEDKNVDVVAANGRRNAVEILFGDGRGRFGAPSVVTLEPGYLNYSYALGDIDGDRHLDLVAESGDAGSAPGLMVTMRGDGKGGFKEGRGSRSPVPPGSRVRALADVDGDHRPDVVFTREAELGVLLNRGDGEFQPAPGSPWRLDAPAHAVVVADLDGNRNADLLTATVDRTAPYRSRVALLLGDGRGFAPAPGSPFPVGPGAYNLAVGDVNEDGKLDVAASSFEGDGVAILLGVPADERPR
jgi:hypothetical protein